MAGKDVKLDAIPVCGADPTWSGRVFTSNAVSGKTNTMHTIIKEVQQHPVSGSILHIDFNEISMTKKIHTHVPVIAVGGGAFLVPDKIAGVSEVIHVEHAGVANAVGAAIAQISGECDEIFQGMGREAVIAEARKIAEDRAVAAGADRDSLQTVEVEDLPLAYMPGDSLRARVRVVGDIAA